MRFQARTLHRLPTSAEAAMRGRVDVNLQAVRIFRKNSRMAGQQAAFHGTSALLSFTARNVRSFEDEVNLSLLGTRLSDKGVARVLMSAGHSSPLSVLPVAGVFGANASGKSTLLRAMSDMRVVVLNSFRRGDRETKLFRHPFLLHGDAADRPSSFTVDLILDGVRWQYGFEINDRQVLDEYAYHYPKGRQALVFGRRRDERDPRFGPGFRSSGSTLARLVRKNALLLSVAGAVADNSDDEQQGVVAVLGPLGRKYGSCSTTSCACTTREPGAPSLSIPTTNLRGRSRGSACSGLCSIRYAGGRCSWWTSSTVAFIRTSCNSSSDSSRIVRPTRTAHSSSSTPTTRRFWGTVAAGRWVETRSGSPRRTPTARQRCTRWRTSARRVTRP